MAAFGADRLAAVPAAGAVDLSAAGLLALNTTSLRQHPQPDYVRSARLHGHMPLSRRSADSAPPSRDDDEDGDVNMSGAFAGSYSGLGLGLGGAGGSSPCLAASAEHDGAADGGGSFMFGGSDGYGSMMLTGNSDSCAPLPRFIFHAEELPAAQADPEDLPGAGSHLGHGPGVDGGPDSAPGSSGSSGSRFGSRSPCGSAPATPGRQRLCVVSVTRSPRSPGGGGSLCLSGFQRRSTGSGGGSYRQSASASSLSQDSSSGEGHAVGVVVGANPAAAGCDGVYDLMA